MNLDHRIRNKIDPLAGIARASTHWAITHGIIQRPKSCEACGKFCQPNAHHPNYTNPFRIIWLCRSCHKKIHGNGIEGFKVEAEESLSVGTT